MIDVIIPVLGRAEQIEAVLSSLESATENSYRVVFVCSPGDKEALAAAQASDADTIVVPWQPGPADYAKKLNLAYERTEQEWIFQAATDLVFHPNWDYWALRIARYKKAGVVGTNDLGNQYVMRGLHSTHSLIARDYLVNYGGTFDNSGAVFSETYDHQWTDVEFVETARRRKQFAHAKRSHVEHMHPHWGKAPMDSTYEKATRATSQDQQLFTKRRRMI